MSAPGNDWVPFNESASAGPSCELDDEERVIELDGANGGMEGSGAARHLCCTTVSTAFD